MTRRPGWRRASACGWAARVVEFNVGAPDNRETLAHPVTELHDVADLQVLRDGCVVAPLALALAAARRRRAWGATRHAGDAARPVHRAAELLPGPLRAAHAGQRRPRAGAHRRRAPRRGRAGAGARQRPAQPAAGRRVGAPVPAPPALPGRRRHGARRRHAGPAHRRGRLRAGVGQRPGPRRLEDPSAASAVHRPRQSAHRGAGRRGRRAARGLGQRRQLLRHARRRPGRLRPAPRGGRLPRRAQRGRIRAPARQAGGDARGASTPTSSR